ncbi:MAG: FixH family protein [Acetobacteraceae bacterium]|nr:FixH family protein [Acetobacteraceae bacterium]
MLVAFILVNLGMAVIATRSDPGLVAGSPARLGTGQVLPPATGLRLEVAQAPGAAGGGPIRLEARLCDRDGRPAQAANVTGALQRATDARADAALAFAPGPADPDGGAPWRATLPDLPAGAWDLAVQAHDGAGNVLATATLRLRR